MRVEIVRLALNGNMQKNISKLCSLCSLFLLFDVLFGLHWWPSDFFLNSMTWLRLHRLRRSRSTAVVIRCRQHPLIWAVLASPRGSSVGIEVLCSIFTVTISLYGEMIDPPSQLILSYVKLSQIPNAPSRQSFVEFSP